MTFNRSTTPRPSEALVRAVVAALVAHAQGYGYAEEVLQKLYPSDTTAPLILRAAVSPASLTSSGWAGVLGSTTVADFVAGLGPVSAAARLISMSLQVDLGRNASVMVPAMIPSAAIANFVAEGAAIPVHPLVVGAPLIKPAKLASIVVATRETLQSTAAEAIIRTLLRESVALSLDASMFGTLAAVDGERPAGLRNGVTALTATSGGGDAAIFGDLERLASAVAPVAGASIAFVLSPDMALKFALRGREVPYPILTSAALAAGTAMAIATNALVTAVDPAPEIDTSNEAVLHMDSSPTAIGTTGTPATVAAPARSLWSTDCSALRLILGASWNLRASGAVAHMSGMTW